MLRRAADSRLKEAPRRLAAWRVLVWLVLLLAAMGCLQYVTHLQKVWTHLQATPATDADTLGALRGMLAWDLGYLVAAFALIVISAGCILRQEWARPCMRIATLLLGAWLIFSGYMQWQQLQQIDARAITAATQAQLGADVQLALELIHRDYLLALGLRALAVPLLLWLSWLLGQERIRAQFHRRRGARIS